MAVESITQQNIRQSFENSAYEWKNDLDDQYDSEAGIHYGYPNHVLTVRNRFIFDGHHPMYSVNYSYNPPKVKNRITREEVKSPIDLNVLTQLKDSPDRIQMPTILNRLFNWIKSLTKVF